MQHRVHCMIGAAWPQLLLLISCSSAVLTQRCALLLPWKGGRGERKKQEGMPPGNASHNHQ
eukprot:1156565-Pelagomonas_calceolata.AAC.3